MQQLQLILFPDERRQNWHWLAEDWCDLEIEAYVEAEIASGNVTPPEWKWRIPATYNGADGNVRVTGWKKVKVAISLGLLPPPNTCSICLRSPAGQMHNEDYSRPLKAKPICFSCHRTLHGRFKNPVRWDRLLERHAHVGAWFLSLSRSA